MLRKVRFWIPYAISLFLVFGVVYLTAQQILRHSADDPQIQMSEDLANTIPFLQDLSTIGEGSTSIDMAKSLSPFVMVYDENKKLTLSTGLLNGKPAVLPKGVLDAAKKTGQNRITWEPQPGVRIATVVTYFQGGHTGYVLAGRNLREVELRERVIFIQVSMVSISALALSLLAVLVFIPVGNPKK